MRPSGSVRPGAARTRKARAYPCSPRRRRGDLAHRVPQPEPCVWARSSAISRAGGRPSRSADADIVSQRRTAIGGMVKQSVVACRPGLCPSDHAFERRPGDPGQANPADLEVRALGRSKLSDRGRLTIDQKRASAAAQSGWSRPQRLLPLRVVLCRSRSANIGQEESVTNVRSEAGCVVAAWRKPCQRREGEWVSRQRPCAICLRRFFCTRPPMAACRLRVEGSVSRHGGRLTARNAGSRNSGSRCRR